MSGGAASRRTNLDNSVNGDREGNSADGENELPTVDERVAEFVEDYPELAKMPVASGHGVSLRESYTWENWSSWSAGSVCDCDHSGCRHGDEPQGDSLRKRGAVTWAKAVRNTLESYETTRDTTVNLQRAEPGHPEYAEHSVDVVTRWFSEYQKRYFAQLKAWLRELTGGERPSGGVSHPEYDDPRIALVTLSASSVPGGDRVGPVDHSQMRRSSWSDGCYDTLRNQMRSLGMKWQYDRRSEPHTGKRGSDGKGMNECYGHDHVVLVVDGEIEPADLRPVVEKHVENCDWAGAEAHGLDKDWSAAPQFHECDCETGCNQCLGTVSIRDPDELEDIAAYVADYCSIEPTDLLERDTAFIAWAAAVDAANTKTISRSDAARWASVADRCKQQFESEASDQVVDHGEELVLSDRRGTKIECKACGSPHGIDQGQTLTAARSPSGPAAADGGLPDRGEQMLEEWPSARSVAGVGEELTQHQWREKLLGYAEKHDITDYRELYDASVLGELGLPAEARDVVDELVAGVDPNEPVYRERLPEWRVDSVTIDGEEHQASSAGGVDLVELVDPVARLLDETELGDPGAKQTKWRFERTNFSCYGGKTMARYLVKHGFELPELVNEVIIAERGTLA